MITTYSIKHKFGFCAVMTVLGMTTTNFASAADVCPAGCVYSTIQGAINNIPDGEITVGPGTYNERINFGPLTSGDNRALISTDGPESTIIDVTGLGFPAVILNGTRIQGFTITGGVSNQFYQPGGVRMEGYGGGEFVGNIVTNNSSSGFGGGFMVGGAGHVIEGNLFSYNSARQGGGIYISNSATSITIDKNRFESNSSQLGGAGIYQSRDASSVLSNNVFSGNSTPGNGGAIYKYNNQGGMEITNSTFVGNAALKSSGIHNGGGASYPIIVTNSIFWNNHSTYYGTNSGVILEYSITSDSAPGTPPAQDPLFVDAFCG